MASMFAIGAFAQAPEKMSYQAVIRNSSGELVKSSNVGMQISILKGSATGTAVYVETQIQTTNANGLVTLEIGDGTIVTGTFDGIDWSTGIYFIKIETDPTGGTSYSITGTSQLLSVPYALYAKNAVDKAYVDALEKNLRDLEDIVYTQLPLPTDGLVAYYPFSGNANDESGNGYNGTVEGATLTEDRLGKSSSAYSFDGTSSKKITVDFSTPLNTSSYSGITISAWCKLTDLTQPHNILTLHDNSFIASFLMSYDYSVQKFYGLKYSGNSGVYTLNKVNSHVWYNVVITFDNSTHIFKLYLNNVLQGQATYTDNMPLAAKLYI